MVSMENAEEVMQILERFTRLKQKEIPKELDEYLQYVAKTGDTVFKWSSLKYLFREKLLNVMKHFYDTSPRVDEIPQYPNVDPFNYESMKSSLLERLELFNAAPFTIQRLCELLIDPRKQYSRIDKFMRALEKNILVVSTMEPGRKRTESENGDSLDSVVNGDLSLDVNVDIDMENESLFNMEAQNGSSNGTASAAAESATTDNNSITENESKEKSPVKEASKHTLTDDEILPNPKKAKLEVDEKEKENNKTAEDEVAKDDQSEAKTETVDVKPKNEVKVAKKEEDNAVETETTKAEVDEPDMQEGSNDVELKEVQEKNETLKEQEEKEAVTKSEVTGAEVEKKQSQEEKTDEETDKKEPVKVNETEESTENKKTITSEVDAESASDAKKETESPKLIEDHEKVIEKQEIEKVEKHEVVNASTENKSKETVVVDEAAGDKGTDNASTDAEISQNASKTETPVEISQVEVKAPINADATEKNEEVATKKTADTASNVENGPKGTEAAKDAVDEVANSAENTKEEKTEVVNESEDVSSAEKVEVNATETEVAAAGEEVPSVTEKEPVAVLKADDEPTVENVTADESSTEVQPAATITAENETSADTVGAAATPTVALNDHPMDDVPIEEPLPAIDEVVMADTGAATEMATDANEPAKDEPAGMEVDDTSQEAMDQ